MSYRKRKHRIKRHLPKRHRKIVTPRGVAKRGEIPNSCTTCQFIQQLLGLTEISDPLIERWKSQALELDWNSFADLTISQAHCNICRTFTRQRRNQATAQIRILDYYRSALYTFYSRINIRIRLG